MTQHATPAPDGRRTTTLLVPFDTGHSFFLDPPRTSRRRDWWNDLAGDNALGEDAKGASAWTTHLHCSNTRPSGPTGLIRFPAMIRMNPCPLGFGAKRVAPRSWRGDTRRSIAELPRSNQAAIEDLDWIDHLEGEPEVLCFTSGVGLLVMRTSVRQRVHEDRDLHRVWRDCSRVLVEPWAAQCASDYVAWAQSRAGVRELTTVRRRGRFQAFSVDPLFFVDELPELVECEDLDFRGARMRFNWSEAYVAPQDVLNRADIEATFMAAVGAWYALQRTDINISRIAYDWLADQSARRRPHTKLSDIEKARLAYEEVADAARPIRWTESTEYLAALEKLLKAWNIRPHADAVKERLSLLNTIHHQMEFRAQKRRERRTQIVLGGVGLTIAFGQLILDAVREWLF